MVWVGDICTRGGAASRFSVKKRPQQLSHDDGDCKGRGGEGIGEIFTTEEYSPSAAYCVSIMIGLDECLFISLA